MVGVFFWLIMVLEIIGLQQRGKIAFHVRGNQ